MVRLTLYNNLFNVIWLDDDNDCCLFIRSFFAPAFVAELPKNLNPTIEFKLPRGF